MAIQIGVITFLVVGAIYDLKTRTVPNVITNSLMALALLSSLITMNPSSVFVNVAVTALVVATFYVTQMLGGADVKGMIIIIFALGANYFLGFLYYFAFFALITFVFYWMFRKKSKEEKMQIPMYVPMAIAAGWMLIGGMM